MFKNRWRFSGFTLVEMAIVIMIASVMLSAGLSLLTVKMNAARYEATKKHQEAIKQALINYLGKNQRLPCPATAVAGTEDRDTAATFPPCVSYSGIVPYQTLGLERAVVLDGWENYITYVISPNPVSTTPPPLNAWLYTFGISAPNGSSDRSLVFWPSNVSGSINITGINTIPNIVVALISYGSNGYGAVNTKSVQNDSTDASADELINISPVTAGTPPTVALVKRDTTDSTAGGGAFDDIVMILSANDLTGPLIASGTLQSSAQVALNQANDLVIGNIVASKKSCSTYPPPLPATQPSTCFPSSLCVCASGAGYFYTIPPVAPSFPFSVTPGALYIDAINSTNPTSSANAYTLTAGDGTQKTVLISELRGLLTRGAGFN